MKSNEWSLRTVTIGMAVCGLLMVGAVTASAQRGFDSFNVPKTLLIANGANTGAATGSVTNGPFDVRVLDGLASLDCFLWTNTVGGTMTLTVQASANSTNGFANVTGLAFINTTTTISYTNSISTNQIASDVFLIPGTYTNYVTSVNLAAGTVLLPPAYTNSGALTLPIGYSKIGWSVDDSARYVQFIWAPGGTATNLTYGATLTGVNPAPLK